MGGIGQESQPLPSWLCYVITLEGHPRRVDSHFFKAAMRQQGYVVPVWIEDALLVHSPPRLSTLEAGSDTVDP